jgi:hypothetical protein
MDARSSRGAAIRYAKAHGGEIDEIRVIGPTGEVHFYQTRSGHGGVRRVRAARVRNDGARSTSRESRWREIDDR